MPSLVKTIPVEKQGMAVYSAFPEALESFPGLVVIQHAPGVDTFICTMVNRLAEAGYAATAPDLYHRQPPTGVADRMKQLKDAEVIADVNAAADYLRQEPGVQAERMGIVGFCMGGRVAYLLAAAANPHFQAAVVYYGGNTKVSWGAGPTPFERSAEIHAPLLFHFGAEDKNPSPEDMRALDAELSRHKKPHEFHAYPGAGHAFMNFTNAERHRPAAAAESWPRTLDFLARHLRK